MRAKRVPKKAVVFDFDDTLVQTDVRTHIYRDGRKVLSLPPDEFYDYERKPGEKYDYRDYTDPRFILNARKYKMWPALESIYHAQKSGRSDEDIYILTAREPVCAMPIWTFLKRNGIILPDDHIITIGNGDHDNQNVPEEKKKILDKLKMEYDSILFYDDSEGNIKLAGEIGGVQTMLVD
jgi:FMN phosphatase YigB (HAD superfamily)